MKRFNILGAFCAAALACAFCSVPSPARAAQQIIVQQSSKPVWLKAEVVHFDRHSMVVRDAADNLRVLTFTYAASAQPGVEKALDKGGYQYGDMIKIKYMPGQTIALAVHGKLTKVKTPKHPTPTAPLHPTSTSKR
jgi:hypothetical protein